jgi:hypothetical protein
MEDKRGIKCECSPSTEGSPLPDDAKTPPPVSSRLPPPPGSPTEVLLRRPYSPVFEQGNASGKTPMIDPSSFIVDTSHDLKLARNFLAISTVTSSGRLVTARSSSSMIPMMTARHKRRRPLVSNPWQLLFLPTRPQMLLLVPTMLLQGQRSILVMIRGPIRKLMVTAVDVAPTSLRLSHQEQGAATGVLQGHP